MRKFFIPAILALSFLSASSLHAQIDNYGLGNGQNGAITISASNVIINQYARVSSPITNGDKVITVNATTGFTAGSLVMIWQATNYTPVPASGQATPFTITSSNVGHWEFGRVQSLSATTITLASGVYLSYPATYTQVVQVPEYTNVTINASKSMLAQAWSGNVGGIIVFLATGTVTNNGLVLASGTGFRGGAFVTDFSSSIGASGLDEPAPAGAQKGESIVPSRYGSSSTGRGRMVSGAGGGVAYLSGGGGGGNGGAGGQGGNSELSIDGGRAVGGQGGGAVLPTVITQMIPGGGGGAGHGDVGNGQTAGSGGGVIFIRAGAFAGTGSYSANGNTSATAGSDAGSGGGGGGTIYLRSTGNISAGLISANGGAGGSTNGFDVGPGGGGGGGVLVLQGCSISATRTVNGGTPGTQTDGGAPGGINYGAASGSTGLTTTIPGCMVTPTTPTLTQPANNATTTSRPLITGTAQASATVSIVIDGTIYTTNADASGNYSYTPASALSDGTHTLAVYSTVQALSGAGVTASFTSSAVLPVNLLSFTAARSGSDVAVGWQTAEETNVAHFTLQHSSNGNDYADLYTAAPGAAHGSYSYLHRQPGSGTHYYRLTETDRSGHVTIYAVKLVSFSDAHAIMLSPVPADNSVRVTLPSGHYRRAVLTDALGRKLEQQTIAPGQLQLTFDLSARAAGLYHIQLDGEDGAVMQQFIKK